MGGWAGGRGAWDAVSGLGPVKTAGCACTVALLGLHASWPARLPLPLASPPNLPPCSPSCAVHDARDPEYTILKQRLARRLRYEGADDDKGACSGLHLLE